jgi:uncharacterized protein
VSGFDFDDLYGHLDALITELQLDTSASALHGSLCGLLVSDAKFEGAAWLDLALVDESLAVNLPDDIAAQLAELAQHQRASMQQAELGISPLLPDDESDLNQRVEALHEWCGGFLAGLGLSGKLKKQSPLSKDGKEALADIERLARSEIELDQNDPEADEHALMELFEYVRVACSMLFVELSTAAKAMAQKPAAKKLH